MQTEKNSACVTPPSARAAASTAKLGASADTRLLSAKHPVETSSRRLPGTALVASTPGTAKTATSTAHRLTTRPITDSLTPRSAAIVGSRPTGEFSVATQANAETMSTSKPARAEPSPVSAGPADCSDTTTIPSPIYS